MTAVEQVSMVDATLENIGEFGLCGYKDPDNPAYRRKLAWLERRFDEGMRYKILHSPTAGSVGSIEYLPGEFAWRGIDAPGYMVIHCLFLMNKSFKGQGYGSLLVEVCERDSRKLEMHGVAVVTSKSTWMAKKEIFVKRGYELIEEAPPHYQLMVKRFRQDAPLPRFSGEWREKLSRYSTGLTILHSDQCPFVVKSMSEIPRVAREEFGVEPDLIELPDCRSAQQAPNPYGVFSIVWNGELVADHPISATRFRNIMKKALGRPGT